MPEFLRFRLWHLFVIVFLCAIPCAWYAHRYRELAERREVVRRLEEVGADVIYTRRDEYKEEPENADWGRRLFGDPFAWEEVDGVWFHARSTPGEEEVALVETFPQLTSLQADVPLSDRSVAGIGRCRQLRKVWLEKTQLTDAALDSLLDLEAFEEFQVAPETPEPIKKKIEARLGPGFQKTQGGIWMREDPPKPGKPPDFLFDSREK